MQASSPILKFMAAMFTAVITLLAHIPMSVHSASGVAIWFFLIDTATGTLTARIVKGGITSSDFRNKLHSKFTVYLGILGIAAGMAVLGQSWQFIVAGWLAICAAEAISIGENMRPLLEKGGAAMAPVAKLLARFLGDLQARTEAAAPSATSPTAPDQESNDATGTNSPS